jgi:alpha-beta hydrolase superfamily lysophospholipase
MLYEYQYQDISEKGFRVIGITLRGFGKSDAPMASMIMMYMQMI